MPTLTVSIPVYNDEVHVKESIDSILAQSFTDFQLIIVDDGSTDSTPNILNSYTDKRIRIIKHPYNMGRPVARNTALDAADSKYFAWMDADDIALPHRLQRQIVFLDAYQEISICGGRCLQFHEKYGVLSPPCKPSAITATTIFYPAILNPTAMMRLSDIRYVNLRYDLRFQRAQDFVFWIRAFLEKQLNGANLCENLCRYRVFSRPSSPYWHSLAIKEYVIPWLGLPCSKEELSIHSGLGNTQRTELIRQYGVDAIFAWLQRLNDHCQQKNYFFSNTLTKIIHEHAERIIAFAPNPIQALHCYQRTKLSKSHALPLLYGRTFARWGKKNLKK